jgi:nucleotide-binding universal stress UspA family protein
MTTAMPPARFQHPVVGYDGSPPASRALDAAAQQLQGRPGRVDVVYVAHLSSLVALSPGAVAEMEEDFDEIEKDLRAQADEQLRGSGAGLGVRTAPGHHRRSADRRGHRHRRSPPG